MRALLAEIAAGALGPGDAALREADIAGRFGVSRGVARECVRGLEERGLVSVKPGRAATVNPPERWAAFDPEVVSALVLAQRGEEIVGDYLECQRILEVEVVALAAERADGDDLAALADGLARMSAAAQRAAVNPAAQGLYDEADVAFHGALVAAAHNSALTAMLSPLWRALGTARGAVARRQPLEQSLATHRRILIAIGARNADEARAAMREHMTALERDVHRHSDGFVHRRGVDEHRAA